MTYRQRREFVEQYRRQQARNAVGLALFIWVAAIVLAWGMT